MWEPRCRAALSVPVEGVHLQKEVVIIKDPLILVMSISRLHIVLDQLKNEATP